MGASQSSSDTADQAATAPKKSMLQRVKDSRGNRPISEEDILRYTGKSRDELKEWADGQPGVGKNQLAGKLAIGPTSGLGGMDVGGGFGGWGPGAEPNDGKRGMKFPPERREVGKTVEEEEED